MKRITLLAITAILLSLTFAACTVNDTTGAITVQNTSDQAAKNVKVGKVNIGYVAPGEVRTVYFFKNEENAAISIEGFELNTGDSLLHKEEIAMTTSHAYTLKLLKSNDKYVYAISGLSTTGKTESLKLKL